MKNEIQKAKSLYGINEDYLVLMNEIQDADGEITEEQEIALAINRDELEKKAIGYIAILKYKGSQRSFISEEIKRLQEIDKQLKNVETRLQGAISSAMNIYELDEIQLPLHKLSFRKSKSVEIDIPAEELPDQLKLIKTTHIPKMEIRKLIEAGQDFKGVRIVENKSLQIK